MLDAVNSGGTCRILFFLAVKIDKLYFRFSQVLLCLFSKSRSFRFHVWILDLGQYASTTSYIPDKCFLIYQPLLDLSEGANCNFLTQIWH